MAYNRHNRHGDVGLRKPVDGGNGRALGTLCILGFSSNEHNPDQSLAPQKYKSQSSRAVYLYSDIYRYPSPPQLRNCVSLCVATHHRTGMVTCRPPAQCRWDQRTVGLTGASRESGAPLDAGGRGGVGRDAVTGRNRWGCFFDNGIYWMWERWKERRRERTRPRYWRVPLRWAFLVAFLRFTGDKSASEAPVEAEYGSEVVRQCEYRSRGWIEDV